MPIIDTYAAAQLRRLREESGHSCESLAVELAARAKREGWGTRGTVDAHTIRRIEDCDHKPGVRVRFVLASFFGVRMEDLWRDENSRILREAPPRRPRRPDLAR